jgi:ABC-type Fe3+/spermidine/putrescine transport system ATPase subunit
MVMSDRIIVMDKGLIQQSDVPRKIYESPANTFVADFIGLINFFEGTVLFVDDSDGIVELNGIPGPVQLKCSLSATLYPGDKVTLAVRPEAITLSKKPVDGAIPGRLLRKIYLGNETDFRVALGDKEVRATADTAAEDFSEGSTVWMTFKKTLVMGY